MTIQYDLIEGNEVDTQLGGAGGRQHASLAALPLPDSTRSQAGRPASPRKPTRSGPVRCRAPTPHPTPPLLPAINPPTHPTAYPLAGAGREGSLTTSTAKCPTGQVLLGLAFQRYSPTLGSNPTLNGVINSMIAVCGVPKTTGVCAPK